MSFDDDDEMVWLCYSAGRAVAWHSRAVIFSKTSFLPASLVYRTPFPSPYFFFLQQFPIVGQGYVREAVQSLREQSWHCSEGFSFFFLAVLPLHFCTTGARSTCNSPAGLRRRKIF